MIENLVCPISNITIDRNVVRTNGLITTLLLLLYVGTGWGFIIVPIGLDYVLRAMMHGPTSPMAHLAKVVAGALGIPFREMDKAPKVFASRIGVCFAMGAAIAHFAAPSVAQVLAGTLAIFTAMESILDLCVGCVVYTYLALPLFRARDAAKRVPLFRKLEDAMLIGVANGFQLERHPAGTALITEGEPGTEMFLLWDGTVEIFHQGADGRVNVVATRERGSVFGEMALLWGKPRVASVRATSPVALLRLTKTHFDALLVRHPRMRDLLEETANERLAAESGALTV